MLADSVVLGDAAVSAAVQVRAVFWGGGGAAGGWRAAASWSGRGCGCALRAAGSRAAPPCLLRAAWCQNPLCHPGAPWQVDLQQLEAAMLATEYQLVDFGNAMCACLCLLLLLLHALTADRRWLLLASCCLYWLPAAAAAAAPAAARPAPQPSSALLPTQP